jgi:GntR family transcriptional regulator / MocR family aminotransferase
MDVLFELAVERAAKGSRDAGGSIYRQLKTAIIDGRLRPGTRLPASRQAMRYFGVSRNTVSEVYERLRVDGYVLARAGSGTYVATRLPSAVKRDARAKAGKPDTRLNETWLRPEIAAGMGFWQDQPETGTRAAQTVLADFRPALLDSRLFPFDLFRRVVARQLRSLEKRPARYRSPQGNQGNYHLRNSIVGHIALTRAVACDPDDVVVTAGAQQAFDLLARVLVKPRQTVVAVEEPGYPPMRAAFAAAGAKVVGVEVDAQGLMVEKIPPGAAVICVCPSHQFPLGVAMSPGRRRALIQLARERNAVIIEDDYDGEFRYDGAPLQALREASSADVVFYVGTFSKSMLPSLRLGFVVAPQWAMQALVVAKNCMDWHCSTIVQQAVSGFISEGHLARHVRKMRRLYESRRHLLRTSLQRDFSQWLKPIPSFYGMHIAATAVAPGTLDLDAVADSLAESQVRIHSLARFYAGSRRQEGFVFGYGAANRSQIAYGLEVLRSALAS